MSIQAVIFDLDGTLLNTIEDIAEVTNYALLKNKFPAHPVENYQHMVGHGLRNLIEQALEENTSENIDIVLNDVIEYYSENPVKHTFSYDGITDLLKTLNQANLPVSVLSNKMHEITVKIIKIIFPMITFSSIYGSRNNIPKKPDPVTALQICTEMAVKPENVIFVGDSSTDIKTALNAGMIPVGVSWGYRPVESIQKAGAEIILDHPSELLNYINSGSLQV